MADGTQSDLACFEASLKSLKLLHKSNLRLIKGGGTAGAGGGAWPFSVERVWGQKVHTLNENGRRTVINRSRFTTRYYYKAS